MKLTYTQKSALTQLGEGPVMRFCTNSTLSALERRGLAEWDPSGALGFVEWTERHARAPNALLGDERRRESQKPGCG